MSQEAKLLEMLKGMQELLGRQGQLVNAPVRKLESSPETGKPLHARRLPDEK